LETVLVAAVSAAASFIGSYCALLVHVKYMQRDLDRLALRVERLEGFSR